MNRGKTRAGLLGVAALYLLHLAFELYQDRGNQDTTMTPAARVLFIALFVIAAAGLLVYTVRLWRHSDDGDKEEQPPREDGSSMK